MKFRIIVAVIIFSGKVIRPESVFNKLNYQTEILGGPNLTLIKSVAAKETDKNSAASSAIIFPTGQIRGWAGYQEYAAGIAVSCISGYRNQNNGGDNSILTGGTLNVQFQYIPIELRVKYSFYNLFANNFLLKNASIQFGGGAGIPISKAEVTKYTGQINSLKFSGVSPIMSLAFSYAQHIWEKIYFLAELQASYLIDNGFNAEASAALLGVNSSLSANTLLLTPLFGIKYVF